MGYTHLQKMTSGTAMISGKKCWNHCVTSQGSYFEGDNL